MRKLRLDLDALRVQSFATRDADTIPFGTVHAGQKEPTGWHDPQCSAVLPCESKLGCSEVATCQPTHNQACHSREVPCVTDAACVPEDPTSSSQPSHWSAVGPMCKLTQDHKCPVCSDACSPEREGS